MADDKYVIELADDPPVVMEISDISTRTLAPIEEDQRQLPWVIDSCHNNQLYKAAFNTVFLRNGYPRAAFDFK